MSPRFARKRSGLLRQASARRIPHARARWQPRLGGVWSDRRETILKSGLKVLRVRAETMAVSTRNTEHRAVAVTLQVAFGRVSVGYAGETGVVAIPADFGTMQDEHDWNKMVDWAWDAGLVLRFAPASVRPDGTEVYELIPSE